MFKFKINDTIRITAGKDKNQTTKIIKVFPKDNKVLLEGKNTYKKHIKPSLNQKGKIVTLERPISTSNIGIICPHCNKLVRVGFQGNGREKIRVCKKCNKPLTSVIVSKKQKK